MAVIALRAVDDGDLDELFRMMQDPESVALAAFTHDDPGDRAHFDAHLARVLTSASTGRPDPGPSGDQRLRPNGGKDPASDPAEIGVA